MCQDHAHVFIACCRHLGVPARYVSGYLFTEDQSEVASEVEFLEKITDRKIKATLPAPALLGERMWDPDKSKKVCYGIFQK